MWQIKVSYYPVYLGRTFKWNSDSLWLNTSGHFLMKQLDFDMSPAANIMTFRLTLAHVTFDLTHVALDQHAQTDRQTYGLRRHITHTDVCSLSSGSPEFFKKHSLPCAPWCILRPECAYCAFLVHTSPIYRCSGV